MGKNFTRKALEKINLGTYHPFPRSMIKYAKENLGRDLVGVEIGTLKGDNAKNIMEFLDMKKLYLIDPYEEFQDYIYQGNNDSKIIEARKSAERKMKKYGNKVEFIKKTSLEAVKDLPDNLDFVYVDGNHEYEFVKEDILNYYPKIKNGGILGGHDIQNGFCPGHDGVTQAFVEFVSQNKLKPFIWVPDWWVVKGKTLEESLD